MPAGAFAADLRIVTSIKPIHSLASSVMGEMGTVDLLVDGPQSPHGFKLKPSQARQLQDADLIFWIGPQLETFLVKASNSIARKDVSVPLIDASGLHHVLYGHHSHGDDHLLGPEDDLPTGNTGSHEHHGHEDSDRDPHIWLDPENAIVLAEKIAEELARVDPRNGETYIKNARMLVARLRNMSDDIRQQLAGVNDKRFLIFHDAYAHFENRFGLTSSGAITLNPEVLPGARRLRRIDELVDAQDIKCAFVEPQFNNHAWNFLRKNGELRIAELDPLGLNIPAGPELYEALITNMAHSIQSCLQG